MKRTTLSQQEVGPQPASRSKDLANQIGQFVDKKIVENNKKIPGGYTIPVDFTPYEETKQDVEYVLTSRGYMPVTKGTKTETIIPYKKELDEANNMLTNPNKYGLTWKPIEKPSTEQIQALASYMVKTKEKSALLKKKTQDYLQTLTNKEREALASNLPSTYKGFGVQGRGEGAGGGADQREEARRDTEEEEDTRDTN